MKCNKKKNRAQGISLDSLDSVNAWNKIQKMLPS